MQKKPGKTTPQVHIKPNPIKKALVVSNASAKSAVPKWEAILNQNFVVAHEDEMRGYNRRHYAEPDAHSYEQYSVSENDTDDEDLVANLPLEQSVGSSRAYSHGLGTGVLGLFPPLDVLSTAQSSIHKLSDRITEVAARNQELHGVCVYMCMCVCECL
jgi:hypothetical protein